MENRQPNITFYLICTAVFLSSSTWFSGTAVTAALSDLWSLNDLQGTWLTIAVQLGFIFGTILYSLLNIADIFRPPLVFFLSALMGALFNGLFAAFAGNLISGVILRFLTGLTLAGIYPVGMKLVASWFRKGLGWRLGFMVGALTLGTAFPYLISSLGEVLHWRLIVAVASACSVLGGILILFLVPVGPYLREKAVLDWRAAFNLFKDKSFRYQAFGYFGHMWELYAFWSLIGFYLMSGLKEEVVHVNISFLTFSAIAVGALGCIAGGWLSKKIGERRVALYSMAVSGLMCAISGWMFNLPPVVLVTLVLVWGFFVIADSPQFSALAALCCPPEYTGTALTIQNGIGFGITTISIQLLPIIARIIGWRWAFLALVPGPIIGGLALYLLGRHLKSLPEKERMRITQMHS
ncbi:MFS transporter [Acidobacteriota bacterium]